MNEIIMAEGVTETLLVAMRLRKLSRAEMRGRRLKGVYCLTNTTYSPKLEAQYETRIAMTIEKASHGSQAEPGTSVVTFELALVVCLPSS